MPVIDFNTTRLEPCYTCAYPYALHSMYVTHTGRPFVVMYIVVCPWCGHGEDILEPTALEN